MKTEKTCYSDGVNCAERQSGSCVHTEVRKVAAAKAAHTPGPWHASDEWSPAGYYRKIEQPAYYGIGTGAVHVARAVITGCVPHDQARANARLIAAAPDLLEAAKQANILLAQFAAGLPIGGIALECTVNPLRAAIAKAEGR